MQAFTYFAQISLYWLLLYACYWLFLRRHTFFALNRAYLLASLLLAFVLPLVKYPEAAPVIPVVTYAVVTSLPEVIASPPTAEAAPSIPVLLVLVGVVYLFGVLFMSIRLFLYLRKLYIFSRQGEEIRMDGYTLILQDSDPRSCGPVGSFSFLNRIVINRTDYEDNLDTILNHELIHVQQRHSLDILLIEILRVVFWFNPVLILYKRSLQQVHEYLADQSAVQRDKYAQFLLAYALNTPLASLTNHFFKTTYLQNRIKMLYKNRNSRWVLGKYLMVLPVIGLAFVLTAAHERVAGTHGGSTQATNLTAAPRVGTVAPPDAETTTIKGTVRSSKTKEPLPGANVILVGTTTGATTDANGAFEFKEVLLNSKLAISYVGYENRLVEVTKKNQIVNVILEWRQTSLEDLVVVGYQPSKIVENESTTKSSAVGEKGIFVVVEELPEFPGGHQEMYKYLAQNIKYPSDASRNGLEGKVVIRFIVSENGKIRNPEVIKSVGGGIDEEALRVVLNMPSWKPAKQNGRPVPTEYVLPIEFKLDKPKEAQEKRQGKVSNFRNYNGGKPTYSFKNTFNVGTPESIRNFDSPIVSIPATNDKQVRFINFYSREKFSEMLSSKGGDSVK